MVRGEKPKLAEGSDPFFTPMLYTCCWGLNAFTNHLEICLRYLIQALSRAPKLTDLFLGSSGLEHGRTVRRRELQLLEHVLEPWKVVCSK